MNPPEYEDNEERCEHCGTTVGLSYTKTHSDTYMLLCDGCDGLYSSEKVPDSWVD